MRALLGRSVLLVALALMVVGAGGAWADAYPSKPVRILVPYPPGGAVDIMTRTLGQPLSEIWGQPVVIDNRPGAGATIATQIAAKSAPDGYTLLMTASGHAINPLIYKELPYDTLKDFVSISEIGYAPNIVLVGKDVPVHSIAELIALARAQPGQLSYGMPGAGTSPHLAGELLKWMAKIDIQPIAYKGGAPTLNDLVGGQIPMSINNIPESIAQIRAGTVRALGVTTVTRSPVLPDVPSIAETLPGYDTAVWWALIAPAGVAPEIVEKINRDVVAVLGTQAVKERLDQLGAVPVGSTPQALDALIRGDLEKWAPIVKATNMRVE